MGPFHSGCGSGKLITKVNNIIFHLLTTQCVLFSKNIILQCQKISLLGVFCLDIQRKSYEEDSGASLLIQYIEMNIYAVSQKSS